MNKILIIVLFSFVFFTGCFVENKPVNEPKKEKEVTFWTADFVKTFPNQQKDYLEFIKINWANARNTAKERGFVKSFKVLINKPDSSRKWNVVLMTEYSDSISFNNREEIFADIFKMPEHKMKPVNGKGPRDMAKIFEGNDLTTYLSK